MKKVSKKTKIITVASCVLVLIATVVYKVTTAPHVKKEVNPMSMDKVTLAEDSDNDSFVSKGDLIEFEGVDYNKDNKPDKFRVMKTDGNMYTVMSVELDNKGVIAYTASVDDFDGEYGLSYKKSSASLWCSSYFYSLPEYLQNAVVEKELKQSMYHFEYEDEKTDEATDACIGAYHYLYDSPKAIKQAQKYADEFRVKITKVSEIDAGIHNVYLPDVDDILEYLDYGEQPYDLSTLFADTDSGMSALLRSSVDGYPDRTCTINIAAENFGDIRFINENSMNPMFTVQIS